MKIYISGSITHDKDHKRKFAAAEERLTKKGYTVLNPVKISDAYPSLEYQTYMEMEEVMIRHSDCIYMLKGWEESIGAMSEEDYANALGIKVIMEE